MTPEELTKLIVRSISDGIRDAAVEESLASIVRKAVLEHFDSTAGVKELKTQLKTVRAAWSMAVDEAADAKYLHRRNLGSHYYPGIGGTSEGFHTSDCKYCKCWMGGSRSGGPDGVDPFGECPGNPKLRDAYELLKKQSDDNQS